MDRANQNPGCYYFFTRINLLEGDEWSPIYGVEFTSDEMEVLERLRDFFHGDVIKLMAFSGGSTYAKILWSSLPAEEGLMNRQNSLKILGQLYGFNRGYLALEPYQPDDPQAMQPFEQDLLNQQIYERLLAGLINDVLGETFPELVPQTEPSEVL